jgi:hypothetical protein
VFNDSLRRSDALKPAPRVIGEKSHHDNRNGKQREIDLVQHTNGCSTSVVERKRFFAGLEIESRRLPKCIRRPI